jgi:RNA polymerase sigma factor (sigma-70 family)
MSTIGPVPAGLSAGAERRARLAELLISAQAGGREELNRIVGELTPLLWHVTRAKGLDRTTCEDVVQTTWLRLLGHLGDIRTPEALTAWLVTVARREAERLRAHGRREPAVGEETLTGVQDRRASTVDEVPVEELVCREERRSVLWRAVQRLPERCQQLLRVVAYTERPDYDRVAEALGMPRGSIGPTRGRCLAKLREALTIDPQWSWP